jgi:hypothetical protein
MRYGRLELLARHGVAVDEVHLLERFVPIAKEMIQDSLNAAVCGCEDEDAFWQVFNDFVQAEFLDEAHNAWQDSLTKDDE